ncbi:MAG: class II aldolase, partial [Clostridia bacterium]|nr:class II aldolase [Clostridia bacterium]
MIKLDTIIELSREYGSNPDFVLAGGGNTSVKGDGMLFVKASGFRLGNISEEGFVGMDLEALSAITARKYSDDEKTAEAEVLADMMAARLPAMTARPSVEALLHALFPQKYVVHLHPAIVNGLTCGKDGKNILENLFPGKAVWMDEIKPGYTLAMAAKALMDQFKAETGKDLDLLVMQNHGVFFAGCCENCIRSLISEFMSKLEALCTVKADLEADEFDGALAAKIACAVTAKAADNGSSLFFAPKCLDEFAELSNGLCAFTPDHIVYCGHAYALCEKAEDDEAQLDAVIAAIEAYKAQYGTAPKVVVVKGVGAFACGKTHKDAETAKALFCDAMKIFFASRNFGGPRFMAPEMISFIR